MNIRTLKSVAAGSVLALGLVSGAANAATADGTARATILQQVTVTNTSDLQFGTVAIGTGGGSVTVATGGGAPAPRRLFARARRQRLALPLQAQLA